MALVLCAAGVSADGIVSHNFTLNNKGNLRAASAVKDYLWVSGTKGSIARILIKDGKAQETLAFTNTPCPTCDYRGIHAWDSLNAIVIASGMPCVIIKTANGGKTWQTVFEQTDSAWFLDAIKFTKNGIGYALADPINGAVPILTTTNFGSTWKVKYWKYPYINPPSFYAASNSNLDKFKGNLNLVGGLNNAPFLCQLKETNDSFTLLADYTGLANNCKDKKEHYFGYYGMYIYKKKIYTAGGSFNCPSEGQFAQLFTIKSKGFQLVETMPLKGYYSGVWHQKKLHLYFGTNGVLVYHKQKMIYQDSQVYNGVIAFDKKHIALVGEKGAVCLLDWVSLNYSKK